MTLRRTVTRSSYTAQMKNKATASSITALAESGPTSRQLVHSCSAGESDRMRTLCLSMGRTGLSCGRGRWSSTGRAEVSLMEVVPRRGFDTLISTLKGWRPNLAIRPGHGDL